MPKITFYADIWPGLNSSPIGIQATTNPGIKSAGVKRVAFDVTIPDELLNDVDGYATEVSKPKQVDE